MEKHTFRQGKRPATLNSLMLGMLWLIAMPAFAQTYNGSVTFTTQTQLDNWPASYTEVNGDVNIQGPTITDLTPLANLVTINGSLRLTSNTNLVQPGGLDGITTVGAKITITGNTVLTNLDALEQITSVGNLVSVTGNPALTDCCGLYDLINTPGVSSTFSNNNTGCDSQTEVNTYCADADGDGVSLTDGDCDDTDSANYPGNVEICDGQDNDCDGTVDEDTEIFDGSIYLSSQAQVDAFPQCITQITGPLDITGNITDLSPLSNLVTLSYLYINNTTLTNLDALENLTSVTGTLFVSNNTSLSDCCGIEHLIGTTFSIISNNQTGCDSGTEIVTYCSDADGDGINITEGDCDDNDPDTYPGAPETCDGQDNNCDGNVDEGLAIFYGDLNLSTQADVEAASCIEEVHGNLRIAGDMFGLQHLLDMHTVTGSIYIRNTTYLHSLRGLDNIETVGGGIFIENNPNLISTQYLHVPEVIEGWLTFRSNPLVTNLDFLQNVMSIGSADGGWLIVDDCVGLTDIDGLSNVQSVGGSLNLSDNPLLTECCALYTLINTPGAIGGEIYISGNNTTCETAPAIEAYCGDLDGDGVTVQDGDCDDNDANNFPGNPEVCDGQDNNCDGNVDEGLETYYGNITLVSQSDVDAFSPCITVLEGVLTINGADITDLSPLSSLTYSGVLNIIGNPALQSLTGLHNMTAADGIYIIGTHLTSLSGLESVASVQNIVTIENNDLLANLDALTGLTIVESRLEITNNLLLSDITGIQNLTSTNNITVFNNPILSDCCVLQDLMNTGAVNFLSINNNNTGCDNPSEITEYCGDNDGDGFRLLDGDCDDNEAAINPDAIELCDGMDNNCNGLTDDEDPNVIGQSTWYADADGDGSGDPNNAVLSCTQPEGYVDNSDDLCPDDGNKTEPGFCGCNEIDTDNDGDAICDDADDCLAYPDMANFNYDDCHCLPGFYPTIEEINSVFVITGCQLCPAGTYCPDGLAAYPCPVGEYSPVVGAQVCLVCEECTTTEFIGAVACTAETVPPTVNCQDVTILLDEYGAASISTDLIDNGSYDDCGIASLSLSQTAFDCSHLGLNSVTLTVEDESGNSNTCSAYVTVEDHLEPYFAMCPMDIGDGLCGDVVTWDAPLALDNCSDVTVEQTEGPANGSVFNAGTTYIAYIATDASGNAASCNFTVTVNALEVQGGPVLHAYFGYPNSVYLSEAVTGGTAPYSYQWSPATDLNDATVASPKFTPSTFGTVIFTVTVTDANGCTGTGTQTVVVEDVRCGNGQQSKVMMCHDGKTICVSQNAVEAHLGHGDYLGACQQGLSADAHNVIATGRKQQEKHVEDSKELTDPSVRIAPNPFREEVNIQVMVPTTQTVAIRVLDIHGQLVSEMSLGMQTQGTHTYQWRGTNANGKSLPSGMYLIVVQSESTLQTTQVVLLH